jgi:8-oxo-dGTP diphosphatase
MSKPIHVAVGVVLDQQGRVLIARRPDHLHQGGLWEFPGGKVDDNETVERALARELFEEVGIQISQPSKLIQIEHDYHDRHVLLDVLKVTSFSGQAHGKESQPVKWVETAGLDKFDFPVANRGIIKALQLPTHYMITAEYNTLAEYKSVIEKAIANKIRLIQFRAKHLDDKTYLQFANSLVKQFQNHKIDILLNAPHSLFNKTEACGLHLSSKSLLDHKTRPVDSNKLLGVSVHNEKELEQAHNLQADFVVLSPVKRTISHPGAVPLGWQRFAEITRKANCPVYALGGLVPDDMDTSIVHGAQGIAGISMFVECLPG